MRKEQGINPIPSIEFDQDVVTRENPLTAGDSGCKVVSMSHWETSRPSGDIRVWFGPGCGCFYGRGRR